MEDKLSKREKQLSESELKECRQMFEMFDKDKDGSISFEELRTVMCALGNNPTEAELQSMMDELDKDRNGVVDFNEFLALMSVHLKEPVDVEEELLEAFRVFDRNNDGYVVASEIKYVMKQLGQELNDEEVNEIIRKADLDNDGRLNYQEFVKTMQERG